ncbi:unnamed protein product, partial [Adineta ricciae]
MKFQKEDTNEGLKYEKTLTCPCSNVTIPYNTFIENTIEFHSVCSSIFIREEWIEGLYLKNPSRYETGDFRTTAYSQFRLLSNLCSYSKTTVLQSEIEFKIENFLNNILLTENELEDKVNVIIQSIQNSAKNRMISLLDYIRAMIRANYLVSAFFFNYATTVIKYDPV